MILNVTLPKIQFKIKKKNLKNYIASKNNSIIFFDIFQDQIKDKNIKFFPQKRSFFLRFLAAPEDSSI